MQSLLRITLLVACAAAGVGVAISLALTPPAVEQADSGEPNKRWLPLPTEQKPKPKIAKPLEPVAAAPAPPAPPAAAHFPTIVPIQMPYQPPVASQIDTLEKGLQQLQEATQRNGDAVVEAIQNLRQNPAQPVAPGNNNPVPQRPIDPLAQPEEMPTPRGISQVLRGEGDNTLTLNLQNSDIRTVLQDISAQAGLNILASKNVTGAVSAVLTDVDIYTALDVILKSTGYIARREGKFIFVGTPEDLQDMDRTQDQLATRVYRPNYVRAMELQQLITPLLSQTVGKISVSSPSEIDIPADVVKTGGDGFAGTDVLIVRDYEMVLRQVDQMVAEVDTQPKQVAIEAMILSVKLEDEYQFGVDFQLLRDNNNVRLVSGSPLANLAQFNLNGEGLRFGFLDASTSVFLNALETIGETNVVAAPRVLCLNKQRAEILIGAQLGYVSTTVTENASTQAIEFLEVGTQLRIRPHIFSDGSIRLEVHPELSTGTVEVRGGFTLPDKEVTQVTTNVMCRDGSTVIIGGLIREDLSNSTSQIPLLGSLPYLGPAFRNKTEKTSRQEIIVLITPRLVCDPALSAEGKQAQKEYAVRQANYADKMSPIAKRHYARHYVRLGTAALNAGDMRVALRYANLAVHFDPQSLDASNLRSAAADTQPEYDNQLHNYLKDGLRPWQHPVRDYTKRGFPWTNGNPPEESPVVVEEVHDLGSPGRSITLDPGQPPAAQNPGDKPMNQVSTLDWNHAALAAILSACVCTGCATPSFLQKTGTDVAPQRADRREVAVRRFEAQRHTAQYHAAIERWASGDPFTCEAQLRGLVARNPKSLEARRALADMALERGDSAGAEAELRELLELSPDDAQTHHSLGLLLESTNRAEESRKHLTQAAKLDPDNTLYQLCLQTDPAVSEAPIVAAKSK